MPVSRSPNHRTMIRNPRQRNSTPSNAKINVSKKTAKKGGNAIQPQPVEKRRKSPGSGRKKGTVNKSTAEFRELARGHGPKALEVLYSMMTHSKSPSIRVKAANSILDRGYGKPVMPVTHTGVDEGPIIVAAMPALEWARRLAFIFDKAERDQARTIEGEAVPVPLEDIVPTKGKEQEVASDS